MNLSNGQTYLAIPGPSVIPEAVLRAMHRASPNIYEGELVDLTHTLIPDLRYVAQTESNVALYIANGHGAWEAALANMACHGDRVLVAATGWFAHGWAKMARAMGIEADIVEYGTQSTIDLNALETALRAHPNDYYKAVLVTHVDTSTSVKNDIAAVRALLDDLGSNALLAVDCVASLGGRCHGGRLSKGVDGPRGHGLCLFQRQSGRASKTIALRQFVLGMGTTRQSRNFGTLFLWHGPNASLVWVACCAGYDPGRGYRKHLGTSRNIGQGNLGRG